MQKLCAMTFVWTFAVTNPLLALDMQGQWQLQRKAHNGTYMGTMVIDQRGQVRLAGRSPTQSYSECGYVQVQNNRIDIVFTSAKGDHGYSPDHFFCALSSDGSLACHNVDAWGHNDPEVFPITRVGALPATPADRLENVCGR